MQRQDIVASFRAELLKAISQIEALKEGNSALKDLVEQLQEQVKVGEGLLQKEKKKRRCRFREYIYCSEDLTVCQAKCETLEAILHQKQAHSETSRSREVEVDQENQALKEEVNLSSRKVEAVEKENKILKKQVDELEDEQKHLQQEVKRKEELVKVGEVLLQKEKKKQRCRFRAYIYCREDLTVCQAKCETLEASLHQEQAHSETSRSREVEVDQENQALHVEVNLLKTVQRNVEDELKKKDKLLQTTPYLNCPATLTVEEKEVNKSQLKMQAPRLRKETTLTEGVSSRKVEAVEKENKTLKKQVDYLKDEQKNLQAEVKRKEELVKKEIRKRQASTRSYMDCLHKLSDLKTSWRT
ncbi:unnamed protein product [Pleuronectes platessa]|uniref:Uncharacterized protein n=1 Tax=Pleuronectes platessa TaxID=8262 RepID=A0A9N7UBG9_PLEPL|nr:unnamed protein product [Pleuronectes platessa]